MLRTNRIRATRSRCREHSPQVSSPRPGRVEAAPSTGGVRNSVRVAEETWGALRPHRPDTRARPECFAPNPRALFPWKTMEEFGRVHGMHSWPGSTDQTSPCRTPAGVNDRHVRSVPRPRAVLSSLQACSHAPYPSARPVAKHSWPGSTDQTVALPDARRGQRDRHVRSVPRPRAVLSGLQPCSIPLSQASCQTLQQHRHTVAAAKKAQTRPNSNTDRTSPCRMPAGIWTAMDRVRAAGSVILWIGK